MKMRSSIAGSLVILLIGVAGCGGDDVVILEAPDTAPEAPASPGAPSAPSPNEPEGPLYMISTRVFEPTGDAETGYMTTVSSLEQGSSFELADAIEIPGGGNAFGRRGDRYVYWASASEPTITRWEILPDGSFARGPVVSFANLGLSNAYAASSTPLYSAEKAYFTDQGQGGIVIWNPSEMSVIGYISLDLPRDGGLTPTVFTELAVRDDRILASVFWSDSDDWTRIGERSRLVAIDPATDSIVSVVDEPRCNQLALGGIASDGTAYFGARSYFTLPRLVFGAGFGAASCALRVVPAGEEYEQGFDVDLGALVGGRPAGDFTLVSDDVGFIRVWHPEMVSAPTPSNWDVMRSEAGFRWWRWRVGAAEAEDVIEQDMAANTVQLRTIDGQVHALRYAPDYSTTTLEEFRPDGSVVPKLSGPGGIYGVVRMR